MELITLTDETKQFLAIVEADADRCVGVVINDDSELRSYTGILRDIKTRMKEVDAKRLELTRPIDATKRSILELFAPYENKLKAGEQTLKKAMVDYESAVAEKRRKEQEEADRKARELEAQHRAELEAKAEKAIEENKPELALAYVEKAESVAVKPIDVSRAARPGISMREDWKFEIVEPNLIPRDYLKIDEVKIGGIVRALKGGTAIPGVRVFSVKTPAVRSY